MELRNRLVMATQMWREATADPLPRMAPGNPVEQIEAFELKLVDMLWERPRRRPRATWPTRPGIWSTTAATTMWSSAASSNVMRRSHGSRLAVGGWNPELALGGRPVKELPELFDLRVKARSLAYLFTAGAVLAALTLVLPHDEGFHELQIWIVVGLRASRSALLLYWTADRVREWQLHVALAAGTTLITLANYYTGAAALLAALHVGGAVRVLLLRHPRRARAPGLHRRGLRGRAAGAGARPARRSAGCSAWARR